MQKTEAAANFDEGENLKFLGTLVPPLIYFWQLNSESAPGHTIVAHQKGLLNEITFELKEGVKVGRAKVSNREFTLTGGSLDFSDAMPTLNEFQTMINGNVQII